MLLLCLSACGSPPDRVGLNMRRVDVPEWARTGKHPDYPESSHLVAFGLAHREPEAREIAERRLEDAICRFALERGREVLEGTRFAEIVTRRCGWFQIEEFGGSVDHELASNGFEYVLLRAIDKEVLAIQAKVMLDDELAKLEATPLPPAVIKDPHRRIELWSARFLTAARVLALRLLASGELDRKAFEAAEEAATRLWEMPGLMVVGMEGRGQHVMINGGTHKPLVLTARYRGRAAAGLPLIWSPAPGFAGMVEGDREFSASGRASCTVLHIYPTGGNFGYVQASLDLDRHAGRRLGIEVAPWLWQLTLPCVSNSELIVAVTEKIGDEETEPVFAPALMNWAHRRGLAAVATEASDAEFPYRLKVEGVLTARVYKRDGAIEALVEGTLTLVDLGTGTTLYRFHAGEVTRGEEGNTAQTVAVLALRDAAAGAIADFAMRIMATLPAGNAEFKINHSK